MITGKPIDRREGRLKVTGKARYSADMPAVKCAHAVLVDSTITRGKIKKIVLEAALRVPGVITVLTHQSGLKLNPAKMDEKTNARAGNGQWVPLQDNVVHFNGQQIAIVLADTLEAAIEASSLVKIDYEEETHNVEMARASDTETFPDKFFGQALQVKWGDPEKAIKDQDSVSCQALYSTPVEHHNPMEPHATLAVWEGDSLTVFDATQGVVATKAMLAEVLDLSPEKIRVVSYFLGGGFGCKGFFWTHTALAAIASRKIGRPVKLVLTRQQMFSSNGHRSPTVQDVTVSATKDGKLQAIIQHVSTQTSRIADFVEPAVFSTKMLYATPNLHVTQRLVKVDTGTPCPQRAPGEAVGSFAVESALDELAYVLKMDPLQLRLVNDTDINPEDGKKFSSRHLKECFEKGAEIFGWSKRKREPQSMREGPYLVGWGMATASYPANRSPASVKLVIDSSGRASVLSATQDIGTGTYTIMAQIAADALGLPIDKVIFELGSTEFPNAPVAGGSQTAASVGNAVHEACLKAKSELLESTGSETYGEALRKTGKTKYELVYTSEANTRAPSGSKKGGPDTSKYSFHSFGAQFAEVRIHRETKEIRLGRMVGAYDVGTVLNAKTARNQCIGGMMWGAGIALMEETQFDSNSGRIVTRNLADYKVPVHADTPPIDVYFADYPDTLFGPIGARGVGELPITGMAAAIANAVFHATGKRIRDLPITPDKLL
jgi:xanthine dehydrogenase YagR molybdenum-binding subunit